MDVLKKVPVREQAPDVRNNVWDITWKRHRKKQQDALIVRMHSV